MEQGTWKKVSATLMDDNCDSSCRFVIHLAFDRLSTISFLALSYLLLLLFLCLDYKSRFFVITIWLKSNQIVSYSIMHQLCFTWISISLMRTEEAENQFAEMLASMFSLLNVGIAFHSTVSRGNNGLVTESKASDNIRIKESW